MMAHHPDETQNPKRSQSVVSNSKLPLSPSRPTPVPKELADLKKRLQSLPVVSRKERSSLPNFTTEAITERSEDSMMGEYSEELRELLRIVKSEKEADERQDMRETVANQRRDVIVRFQHKLNVARETYRRNVKSYLRCVRDYRNETKREEVRANGIKRFKRSTLMEKIKKLAAEQAEQR
jgi:hypothetical protein